MMSSLLDSVAPRCNTAYVEQDWEEECEGALQTHPVLTFAWTLAITGAGLVGAVSAVTALVAVPLCRLAGII